MPLDWPTIWKIAQPILMLFIGGLVARFFERRPKLVSFLLDASSVLVRPPEGQPTRINLHSLVVRNAGKKPALNVRLGHNVLPEFSVHPDIAYRVEALPGGGTELIFPMLVAGEQITIQYLYFPPVVWQTVNTHIKSDDGPAKVLNVLPMQQYSKPVLYLFMAVMVVGFVAIIYVLLWLATVAMRQPIFGSAG